MRLRSLAHRAWQSTMDSDVWRSTLVVTISMVVFLPLSIPLTFWIGSVRPDHEVGLPLDMFSLLLYLGVYWILYSVVYVTMTIWWFQRLDSARLHEKLRTTSSGPSTDRGWFMNLMSSDGTMSLSLQMCLLALIYTVVVMISPEVRAEFGMRILAVLVSVVNWVTVVVTQALAYARLSAVDYRTETASITFPGTPHPMWSDYMTLAVGVSTMLGPADAQLSGSRARRALQSHALVSFAFNSMVIASLATLMLS